MNVRVSNEADLSVQRYSLVLPPGWARIPIRTGSDAAIQRILDKSFEHVSRDAVATARRELQAKLSTLAAKAAERNGLDLYLPTERMHGFTVAASFVVGEVVFDLLDTADPAMVVAALVSEQASSEQIDVAGSPAARAESVHPGGSDAGAEFGARQVDYVIPVPGEVDRWLVATFSTVGQGEPTDALADLLVELFDAIMTTFRWRPA
jgi:hypothetical protein